MPDDDRRPRIQRTNSLFGRIPSYPQVDPRSGQRTGRTNYDPRVGGLTPRLVEQAAEQAAESERRKPAQPTGSFYQQFVNDALRQSRVHTSITRAGSTMITGPSFEPGENGQVGADGASIAGPLDMAGVDPNALFLFDRGGVIDPASGRRTGVAQSRGVYGSADSLERQLPAGQTTKTGTNDNLMTISAGVLWLRNLAARDKAAYNKLVVLLRNAGYGNLPAEDGKLPLNGYSQEVGVAFALAANDLAAANLGNDNRTLMEYLTERGQGYADLLAQDAADKAYVPVERQYQDPATLRSAAKDAAIEALGRKLTDEEEARFEAAFRSREDSFYDKLDTARENKTQFAAYQPDTTGQVSDFIDGDEFQTERAANTIGEMSQVFMRMMGVGG